MSEIFVLAEHRQGTVREITLELVSVARQLGSETGQGVTVVVLGDDVEAYGAQLCPLADRVLAIQDAELAEFNADRYLVALADLLATRRPVVTLLGHTAAGMDLAPALAVRLGWPLATDCQRVAQQAQRLMVNRQIYGGKVKEELTLKPAGSTLVTIRPGCFASAEPKDSAGALERLPEPDWGACRGRKFVEFVAGEIADVDIAAADILVSVGRGVGKPENMAAVEAFAQAIGATLSCSRPVADKGWLPKSRQVGTSGKSVRPKVYLALGISGAYQHVAGMTHADTIIAVNTDPAAPIFEVAHFGIVADMFDVLPRLQERFG